jgi:hypothetical protein
MKKFIFSIFSILSLNPVHAGDTLRALFIGNSYTYVNNLPDVIGHLAASDGNTLVYDISAPGGSTLQQHCGNSTTLNLIQQGNWDYVILQEQSQLPSFPDNQVESEVYPFAKRLDSLVHVYNYCAKTVFYMTWGRKNGDQQNCPGFPVLCTYEGMDSLLQLRYTAMADSSNAYLCPVGHLWHDIRDTNPGLELYQVDESHPSPAGTFVAACSFYALLFDTDLQNNSYHYSLSPGDALFIKTRAQALVADSLDFWRRFDTTLPLSSAFSFVDTATPNYQTLAFNNLSMNAQSYYWDFGDGQSSTEANPIHAFDPGNYTVCLAAIGNCDSAVSCQQIHISPLGIAPIEAQKTWQLYPNPVKDKLLLKPISDPIQFVVYNQLGQRVRRGTLNPPSAIVYTSGLATGVYFIQLSNEKGISQTEKFYKAY